ncbi:MAG: PhoPQ-activated protein PqaA family protein, partial [Cyclobacteriaceae bacterium]
QALQALSSFLAITLNGKEYPTCDWQIEENGKEVMISTTTSSDKLVDALIWTADSEDRDFRDEEFGSKSLNAKQLRRIDTTVSFPESGYRAFYIDLKYVDPIGEEYVVSTRMFVADSTRIL